MGKTKIQIQRSNMLPSRKIVPIEPLTRQKGAERRQHMYGVGKIRNLSLMHRLVADASQDSKPRSIQARNHKDMVTGNRVTQVANDSSGHAVSGQRVARVSRFNVDYHGTVTPTVMCAPPTWGTSKTTAPIGKLRPHTEMLNELKSEVRRFRLANIILKWVKGKPKRRKRGSAVKLARPSFTVFEMFSDKKLMRKFRPRPKSIADLQQVLDLLVHYGVLKPIVAPPVPTMFLPIYVPVVYQVLTGPGGMPSTAGLAAGQKKVTQFTKQFERRAKKRDPIQPIVTTALLPETMAAGRAQPERKAEKVFAKTKLQVAKELKEYVVIRKGRFRRWPIYRAINSTAIAMRRKNWYKIDIAGWRKPRRFVGPIDVIEQLATGSHPFTKARRNKVQGRIAKAEWKLKVARRRRTFAKEDVNFLKELWKRNTSWRASNYAGHFWGEFSLDVFLRARVVRGFYARRVVRQFFDDVNAVAEAGVGSVKKYAWRAIYNDNPLRAELNRKFGHRRILWAPNHGPAPHKLHIHMDLRPVDVERDVTTGYEVKGGRIKIR